MASRGFEARLGRHEALVASQVDTLARDRVGARLVQKDPTLFAGPVDKVTNRLGWVGLGQEMTTHLAAWQAIAEQGRQAGLRQVLLAGMGGSSLCPEVLSEVFGPAPHGEGDSDGDGQGQGMSLHVLDSTSPEAIRATEAKLDLGKTLFLISTKSGTTVETLSLCNYFLARCAAAGMAVPGKHFVGITDPGTALRRIAAEQKFMAVVDGKPEVGGRYSALSAFGLLPAILLGYDAGRMLAGSRAISREVAADPKHPAIFLGGALGVLAKQAGRNKVTLLISPPLEPLGIWIEQLVAESSGKTGVGLVPVLEPGFFPNTDGDAANDESPAPNTTYSNDRVFVSIRTDGGELPRRVSRLAEQGHPVFDLVMPFPPSGEATGPGALESLGAEFWRWEAATAVACHVLGVNPFDEPNVTEAKEATNRALTRPLPQIRPTTSEAISLPLGVRLGKRLQTDLGRPAQVETSAEEALGVLFSQARTQKSSYLAILAFLAPTPERQALLAELRAALSSALGIATTLGFGPRFLHSTGQLHKGGPKQGLFLQITQNETNALPIPGAPYGFETLISAQAEGDFDALDAKELPLLRLHLQDGANPSLSRLCEGIAAVARRTT